MWRVEELKVLRVRLFEVLERLMDGYVGFVADGDGLEV